MTGKLIGRGQYTLVNLHDGKTMRVDLKSNMPFVQFFSRVENTYVPNYAVDNVVIEPEVYFGGSLENQIGHVTNIVWTINGQEPKNFGGTVVKNPSPKLRISSNLTIVSQLKVEFRGDVIDPDTKQATGIAASLCYSKQEEANATPVFLVSYPEGNIFKNEINGKLSANISVKVSSKDMTDMAKFAWYRMVEGQYILLADDIGVYGQGTREIHVIDGSFKGRLNLKCEITFGGKKYEEFATFSSQKDSYVCKVESTNGDKMHNGRGKIVCEAHIYRGTHKLADTEAEKRFVFEWTKYNKYTGEKNTEWGVFSGRKLELVKEDIDKLSTFMCEVRHVTNAFPYKLPLILS